MNTREINETLLALTEHCYKLEEAFVENEGEVTEETISLEDKISALQEILLNETDSLGRWLKSKEDQKAALKAEKAKIDSMIKATDRTIDYIKNLVDTILFATGNDKVKGVLYGFARTSSVTHTANLDLIEDRYHEKVEEFSKTLPVWLKVKLSPSYTLVPDGVETDEFTETVTPTVKFVKPRKTE